MPTDPENTKPTDPPAPLEWGWVDADSQVEFASGHLEAITAKWRYVVTAEWVSYDFFTFEAYRMSTVELSGDCIDDFMWEPFETADEAKAQAERWNAERYGDYEAEFRRMAIACLPDPEPIMGESC